MCWLQTNVSDEECSYEEAVQPDKPAEPEASEEEAETAEADK
jgi:hypothetical protein